jgi:hypothetical protein
VGLILFVLFSPLIAAITTLRLIRGLGLHLVIWLVWCTQGRHVLFVYSNSPDWQDHIEQQILPRLPHNAAVLNWSERQQWGWSSLAVQAFYFFGGMSDYVPLALIFRPFRLTRTFRFFKPFKDHKHGRLATLARTEDDLFEALRTL